MASETFKVYAVAVAGYKEKCGTWPNPVTTDMIEAPLGKWLNRCREKFADDELSTARIEMLNQIIPGWYTGVGLTWEHKAEALSSYLLEKGEMPERSHWLYNWLTVQNGIARCGFLATERVDWIRKHCLGLSDFGAQSAPLWKIS
ncbi:helicase associated domain-containing protein [Glutamicibacter ardleyensis]|uniref:helicase associated domain-containing protein n=1 Tax=Glutamicibacter ardleyensis TaxID=225894 RepID=UPI003FD3BA9D